MARDNAWYIHQRLLYQSLGFGASKIPMDVEKVFVDFPIPIGVRYETVETRTEYGIRRKTLYHPQSTRIGTVIVKAKPVVLKDKYDYRTGKTRPRRIHSAKQRVFVICPNCGRHVPFSRMQQHYGKKTCTK